MAKGYSRPTPVNPFDASRFEYPLQVGGIQTGSLDHPQPGGGQSCRCAFIDTASGLRFTVALDRGGDIVQAAFNQWALGFMTPNGYKPPNPAYHREEDWLDGWPGGLVTTCGPQFIGGPRDEDGQRTTLHGHYSNTPAAVESVINPQPARNKLDMCLSLIIRDSRFYGPSIEIRRTIRCSLGQPSITITDEVTNICDTKVPHNWLYHVNLGYPLLDEGARFIYKGKASVWQPEGIEHTDASVRKLKTASPPRDDRAGSTSDVIFIDDEKPGGDGLRRVGLINDRLGLGLELAFPHKQLPRLANWQHLGPRGAYVTGIEPFSGSLLGKDSDYMGKSGQYLKPGQSKKYDLTLRVLSTRAELDALSRHDGEIHL